MLSLFLLQVILVKLLVLSVNFDFDEVLVPAALSFHHGHDLVLALHNLFEEVGRTQFFGILCFKFF